VTSYLAVVTGVFGVTAPLQLALSVLSDFRSRLQVKS
jgi:hypothetical protein